MRLCAVIPARNEESRLPKVIRGALRHCDHVVVVDDGSRDGTAAAARREGAEVFRRRGRPGKGNALRLAIERLLPRDFDALIFLDADGQHDPGEIPRFVRCSEQRDAPLVTGSRMITRHNMPVLRWLANWLTSGMLQIAFDHPVQDVQCGYKLIRTDLLRGMHLEATKYDIEGELLMEAHRLGALPVEIPVRCLYTGKGSTHGAWDVERFVRRYWWRYNFSRSVFLLWRRLLTFFAPSLFRIGKAVLLFLVAFALIALLMSQGDGTLGGTREALQGRLEAVGILTAAFIFLLLCTLKPLTFLPFSGLTVLAGAVFNLWPGTLLVALGGISSAVVGFWMARWFAGKAVRRHLAGRFPRAEDWMREEGWGAVLFLRCMNAPWDWVSYAAGLSPLSFRAFMTATLIPVLPVAFFGTLAGAAVWTFPSWKFFGAFGLLFLFGTVTWFLGRAWKRSHPQGASRGETRRQNGTSQ